MHTRHPPPRGLAPLLIIGGLWFGLLFVYRLWLAPTPMQQADRLFVQGHYTAAHHAYRSHADSTHIPSAELLLRIGMLHTVRGEYGSASHTLWQAIGQGLPPAQHDLALLYLGVSSARSDNLALALTIWQEYPLCKADTCPYAGVRQTLIGDALLAQHQYAAARAAYAAALDLPLDLAWHQIARTRYALLLAADDPHAAQAVLERTLTHPRPAPFTAPLVPPRIAQEQQLLHSILHANPADHAQLLGQIYTRYGYDALALATFAQVPATSPHAHSAAAYRAYLTWRTSPAYAELGELDSFQQTTPNDPAATTLLLLSTMTTAALSHSSVPTTTLAQLPNGTPERALLEAIWHLFERDYTAASMHMQQLLARSSGIQRGHYALWVARFHLDRAYAVCAEGRTAAELAVQSLPDVSAAWTVLAGVLFQCGDDVGAQHAAQQAIAHDHALPALSPPAEAWLYLGAAHLRQGDATAARHALTTAADLAPASVWRERAEQLLR
mgnify:FL=1